MIFLWQPSERIKSVAHSERKLTQNSKQPEPVSGLLQPHEHKHVEKDANKAETSLQLLQAVSLFCFSIYNYLFQNVRRA